MPVAQVRNADLAMLSQVDLLPLSDRNIPYERYGDAGTTTCNGPAVTIPLANLRLDVVPFNDIYSWDDTDHVLTVNVSGIYQFFWKGSVQFTPGAAGLLVASVYLEQSTNGGSSYSILPASDSYANLVTPSGGLTAIQSVTGTCLLRVVSGYKYRLRTFRVLGVDSFSVLHSTTTLSVIRLIGTPDDLTLG